MGEGRRSRLLPFSTYRTHIARGQHVDGGLNQVSKRGRIPDAKPLRHLVGDEGFEPSTR